jgi:colicin import membrane protein
VPLFMALAFHALAVYALYTGWHPDKEVVNIVQPQTVMANLIVLEPKAAPAPVPKPQPVQKPAPKPEPKPEAKKPEPDPSIERRRREQELAEQARIAEQAREEQERQQRLQELARSALDDAIAQESAELQAGTEEMVVRSYHAAIYDLVRRNWSRPPSARTGMSARLLVELIPTGEVIAVTVVDRSGSAAFDRSAENAVRQAKKFEVPKDNALFEKHFRRFYFLFQPEDLLR